jgi:hypothetical protein
LLVDEKPHVGEAFIIGRQVTVPKLETQLLREFDPYHAIKNTEVLAGTHTAPQEHFALASHHRNAAYARAGRIAHQKSCLAIQMKKPTIS